MRSYSRRRLASVVPGEGHIGRQLATSRGSMELIWEQEAAGSNPAIPTACGSNVLPVLCEPFRQAALAPTREQVKQRAALHVHER
jgi:hypothetical protein